MNKNILVGRRCLEIYSDLIRTSPAFERGQEIVCSYDFDNEKFEQLKSRYPIQKIAGSGGDFERALCICRRIGLKIAHQGDFSLTSDLEFNSLTLLDYALGDGGHGINCVGKAKILVECCLALDIYARSVGLYPNSPFDTDNHVVAEIFDRRRNKWIMLDPTSGGFYTDGKEPLSCLEMRENFATGAMGSAILPRQRTTDPSILRDKNIDWNSYYAKNCYYMTVETSSGFGENDAPLAYLLPVGFDFKENRKKNAEYLLQTAKREKWSDKAVASIQKLMRYYEEFTPLIGSTSLWSSPIR